MIGSHDSMTYLKPSFCPAKLTSRIWRCQCKNIIAQYNWGIRFFDLRVVWDGKGWIFAHGLVKFKDYRFKSLNDLCHWMNELCPKAIYRIVLERDENLDDLLFISQSLNLGIHYPNLWRIDIKSTTDWMGNIFNNNQELYNRGYLFAKEVPWEGRCSELHGTVTKKNFWKIDLRKEAKKINNSLSIMTDPELLKGMKESIDYLYILDYATNEY